MAIDRYAAALPCPSFVTAPTGIALAALLLVFFPTAGLAQDSCIICDGGGSEPADEIPPVVSVSPGEGTFHDAAVEVTIDFCDNQSLTSSSRQITLNGTDVTADFRYASTSDCTASAVSTGTVMLSEGENTLVAGICDNAGNCGSNTATYTYDTKFPPVVSTTPHNGGYRDVSKCALGCFDAILSYSIPAYRSMDAARFATLLYRSSQAHPMPLVQVEVRDTSPTPPEMISIRLKRLWDNTWQTFTDGSQEIFYEQGVNGRSRLAAQFDASAMSTGAYRYRVVVRSWWGSYFEESIKTIRVLVVNEKDSPFGSGWSLAGLQRLRFESGGLVASEGDGSVAYFEETGVCYDGECYYSAPAGDFSILSHDSYAERYTRTYPDGTEAVFGSAGRLLYIQDRFGNRTSYDYTNGRLVRITDPVGKQLSFGYGSDGKLAYIEDPGGRRTNITINSVGELTDIRDPAGGYPFRSLRYNSEGRLYQYNDRAGGKWNIEYDFAGKLARILAPAVYVDGVGNTRPKTRYRSPEKRLLITDASTDGTKSNPLPRQRSWDWSGRVTNPRGYETNLLYMNRFRQPTQIRRPGVARSRVSYTEDGQVRRTVSPSGHEARYTWDGPDLIKVYDETTGRTVHFEYGSSYHGVTHIYGDTREVWKYRSNGMLDSTRVGTSASPVIEYTYTSLGRLTSVSDFEDHTTRYYYGGNTWANLDSVVAPGPRTTSYTYDGYGRVRTITNPAGRTTTTYKDALGRTTKVVDPLGNPTTYDWGPLYLREVTDPKGQRYTFYRNALGWATKQVDPRGNADHYDYDKAGNVTKHVDRRGQAITFTYDGLGRVDGRTAGGETTTWSYDREARWMAVSNSESTDTIWYDVAGRPTYAISRRAGERYVLEWSYNKRGLRTRMFLSSPYTRMIQYRYNDHMQLDTIFGFGGEVTTFDYNADRQANEITLPTGLVISKRFPSTHQPGEIRYSVDAINEALGIKYGQNMLGRIDSRTSMAEDSIREFTYDALGRLDGYSDYKQYEPDCTYYEYYGWVCVSDKELLGRVAYGYDKVGNPTYRDAVVETGNRLVAFGPYTMEYDAAGNLTHKYKNGTLTRRYYWNALGQLTRVETESNVVTFGYDGFGRRVRKTTSDYTRRYLWNGDDVFLVSTGSGVALAEYAYYPGTDRPHSMLRRGDVYYYATDFPGNVVGLIGESNYLMAEYRYGPFGSVELASEQVENRLGYMARSRGAATGLVYMRARYYDPTIQRFISADPIGLRGGVNPYAFVGNNPVNGRDPLGLCDDYTPEGECLYRLRGLTVTAGRLGGWMRPMSLTTLAGVGVWFADLARDRAVRAAEAAERYLEQALVDTVERLHSLFPSSCPKEPGGGYVDMNGSYGGGLGVTGGLVVSDGGIYAYAGGGIVLGAGGSITGSPDDPTPGWNAGVQLQAGIAYQRGVAPGGHLLPNGNSSSAFDEIGLGWPPGGAITAYYVVPLVCR